MGAYLKDLLGDKYYSLGFAFNRGGFQARLMDPESEQNGALIEHKVGEAPEGSVGWYLAQAEIDITVESRLETKKADQASGMPEKYISIWFEAAGSNKGQQRRCGLGCIDRIEQDALQLIKHLSGFQ